MRLIIDQLEENYAVCEDENGNMVDVERSLIPKEAKVGDALLFTDNEYFLDKRESDKLRNEIDDLMDDLWAD